jgi:hypothetical protein
MAKYYFGRSIISDTWDGSHLHPQLDLILKDLGDKHVFVTSTIAPASVLDALYQSAPKRVEQAVAEFARLFFEAHAPVLLVSPRGDIMKRWVALRDTARREGLDLPFDIGIELATADSLNVDAFLAYDSALEAYTKITKSHFPIVRPETLVQPKSKHQRSTGHTGNNPNS